MDFLHNRSEIRILLAIPLMETGLFCWSAFFLFMLKNKCSSFLFFVVLRNFKSYYSLKLGFILGLLGFPPSGVHNAVEQTEGVTLLCNASVTDVIGVCKSVDEATRLTTKSNREVSKRTLHLMDMSGKLVTVTLWGEEVRNIRYRSVCCCFTFLNIQMKMATTNELLCSS